MRSFLKNSAYCTLLCLSTAAWATENGGSSYPHGAEGYMTGAVPPIPGFYGMLYGTTYNASRLHDGMGKRIGIPGFKAKATAITPRFVWVPGVNILGGDLVFHAIIPLLSVKASAMGISQEKMGLGDIILGTGVGHHHSPHFHTVYGLDITAPTGRYDKNDLANIGNNYFSIEPFLGITYADPTGFNGDARLAYRMNLKNSSTQYKSGSTFHVDYSAGWGLGNGWVLGVGGYYKQQTELDKQYGSHIPGSKTSAIAIGPMLKYDSGKGWFVTAKWQKEHRVKNGTQGDGFIFKAVMPF